APLSRRKMGMSTLPVKPRDRVRRRAQAADGGRARPKAPKSGGDFPQPDKQLGSRRRYYGLGEGEDPRSTRLTISDAEPRRARDRRAAGCRKVTLEGFPQDGQHKSQFHRPWRRQFRRGTRSPWVSIGGWAMWIIWYVAMMASLRAVGLAPNPVPVS